MSPTLIELTEFMGTSETEIFVPSMICPSNELLLKQILIFVNTGLGLNLRKEKDIQKFQNKMEI